MIPSGYTSIDDAKNIDSSKQNQLKDLWIDSLEEYVSAMATVEHSSFIDEKPHGFEIDENQEKIKDSLPDEQSNYFKKCHAGGYLGCCLDKNLIEFFRLNKQLPKQSSTFKLEKYNLPTSVRLTDKLFPVRDQGERGTCVAFSTTALREFLDGCQNDLSEQYLYYACKQLDRIPDQPGTFISTAMAALSTKGICQEALWPYNSNSINNNEGQTPSPANADDNALEYIMPYTRPVAPTHIAHYKQVLAGTDEIPGMPVVVAVLVFNSWFLSPATNQTGKITMPFPGELPLLGGHAMLIAGYQDDSSVPGGGYFIVRNSWGEKWAASSPEAKGYAMMPYSYIERYAVEAFSGQAMNDSKLITATLSQKETSPKQSSFEEKYVHALNKSARDTDERLIEAGSAVIYSPLNPDELKKDTPANREKFKKNGFAWGKETRQESWYPVPEKLPEELSKQIEKSRTLQKNFVSALDINIKEAIKKPLPDINLPGWFQLLAWAPKVKSVKEQADITNLLIDRLKGTSGAPKDLPLPANWAEIMRTLNSLKVYSLEGLSTKFYAVVAFVTPLKFSPNDCKIVNASSVITSIIHNVFNEWQKKYKKPTYTFFSLGCSTSWNKDINATASSSYWEIYSEPTGDTWKSRMPSRFESQRHMRDFIVRLRPQTSGQRMQQIKLLVEEHYDTGYEGNLHVEKLANESGIPVDLTTIAFQDLHNTKQFTCYKTPHGKIAIGPGKKGVTKDKNIFDNEHGFFKSHILGFVATFIAVAAWQVGGYFSKGNIWIGIFLLPVVIYLAQCIETTIKRSIKK